MSPSHRVCLIELMPRSDNARFIDFVKLSGVVEGSRRSVEDLLSHSSHIVAQSIEEPSKMRQQTQEYGARNTMSSVLADGNKIERS